MIGALGTVVSPPETLLRILEPPGAGVGVGPAGIDGVESPSFFLQ
jgi:hypothetical protein